MDRTLLPRELRPFVDEQGRLTQWPAKLKIKRMAIDYLVGRFEPGREYTEREVNELLLDGHTFGDWALLRRRAPGSRACVFDARCRGRGSPACPHGRACGSSPARPCACVAGLVDGGGCCSAMEEEKRRKGGRRRWQVDPAHQ